MFRICNVKCEIVCCNLLLSSFLFLIQKCCDSISIVLSSEWVSPIELEDFVYKLLYTGPVLCQIRSHVRQVLKFSLYVLLRVRNLTFCCMIDTQKVKTHNDKF